MSKLKEKLALMTDKELAILIRFRLDEYLKPTQEEIVAYSVERKLTSERIRQLTSEYSESEFKRKPAGAFQKIKFYFQEVIHGILGHL